MSRLDKTLDAVGTGVNRLQIGLDYLRQFVSCRILFVGVYAPYTSWILQNKGIMTTGNVVRLEESNSSEGGCCVYSPVVEFNANGQTYSFEGDNASDPPAYDVGEVVNVIYDPSDPDAAQINKWSERWLFPIIIIPAMIFTAAILNFFMIRAWIRGEDIGE